MIIAVTYALPAIASAQATLSLSDEVYIQEFTTLPSGSSSPWSTVAGTPAMRGWFIYNLATGATGRDTGAASAYGGAVVPGIGNATTGQIYSFGPTGSNERALGSVTSGSTRDFSITLVLRNDTGSTVNSFFLQYFGEQWRNGGNTATHFLDFDYRVFTSSPASSGGSNLGPGSPGYTDPVGGILDFASPVHTAASGPLDGNSFANRAGRSGSLGGGALNWQSGQFLVLRWWDNEDPGNDHGLAMDDLSLVVANGASRHLQFDANPLTPGPDDGKGTWVEGGDNWHTGAGNANWNSANPDNAIFGVQGVPGAFDVEVSGTVSAGYLIFAAGSPNYTIRSGMVNVGSGIIAGNSGTVTSNIGLGASQSWYVTERQTLSIDGNLSGTGDLTKTGAGTLTLGGNSSAFSGDFDLQTGAVIVSADHALGDTAGSTNVASGANLIFLGGVDYTAAESVTINGSTSGAVTSSPFTALAAIHAIGGDARFAGNISFAGVGSTPGSAGLNSLGADADSSLHLSGQLSGGGNNGVAKVGAGRLILSNSASMFDGILRVFDGTVRVTANNALGSTLGITSLDGGDLEFDGGVDYAASETIAIAADNSAMIASSGHNTFRGALDLRSTGANTIGAASSSSLTLTGPITQTGVNRPLIKIGTGTVTLSGSATVGAVTIDDGALRLTSGATLDSNGMSVTISPAARLEGGGAITGPVAVRGTVAPGDSIGVLATAGNHTWEGGGSYEWEIDNATGSAGTNWDQLSMHALTVTASAGNRFKVKIIGRPGTAGPGIDNWNSHNFTQVWVIATTNGVISGFDADDFEIDVSQFNNHNANNGRFEVRYNASTANVEIHYVPEPAGAALLIGLSLPLLLRRHRS